MSIVSAVTSSRAVSALVCAASAVYVLADTALGAAAVAALSTVIAVAPEGVQVICRVHSAILPAAT